ncbi:hypothetical protein [Streptomyces sp. NPDC059861]|uniref:hypothetical protein n=1 Tax=Streptomyces sp. NPDC059861 TaxID=3346974 RepID=UPI0036546F44
MLAEQGPATLRVTVPPVRNVVVMRVLRTQLGVDRAAAKVVLSGVLSGDYSGTLPEMELLARKLRAAGIAAVAGRDGVAGPQ